MAFFSDTPAQFKQVSQYTPQIQSALNQNVLQGLGKNFDFAPIAQQAREQFQTKTLPSIAERFTSLGQGAQRSSAFPAALGQAGAGLESQLAALQSQYGLQQQDLLSRLLGQSGMQSAYQPGQPSALLQLLAPLLMGLGGGIGGGGLSGLGGGLSSLLSQFKQPAPQPMTKMGQPKQSSFPGGFPGGFAPSATSGQGITGELMAAGPQQQNYNLQGLNRLFQRVV